MFKTPILFIIFNRPEVTSLVFEVIRQIKPQFFYVAADGPRIEKAEDIEKCKNARAVIEGIDWECELKTFFRDHNRGCGRGPAEAISWFFENVEEGIILEDDCLPGVDFFVFAEIMLQRYRNIDKVMLVAGTNFLGTWKAKKQCYHFSSFTHTWGWASWRRAWALYDYELKDWGEEKSLKLFKRIIPTKRMFNRLKYIFDYSKINLSIITWWDFQWCYCVLMNKGLCIVPSVNLITNIGIGSDSTHTSNAHDVRTPVLKIGVLSGVFDQKPLLKPDLKFDQIFFNLSFDKRPNLLIRSLLFLIRKSRRIIIV